MLMDILIPLCLLLLILGTLVKPIRKAIGLTLIIVGFVACLTIVGAIIGIPAILIGAIFLFI